MTKTASRWVLTLAITWPHATVIVIVEYVAAAQVHGDGELLVEITETRRLRARLRADKGVNLPGNTFSLAALTPPDLEDLASVARHADIVNVPSLCHLSDLHALQGRTSG